MDGAQHGSADRLGAYGPQPRQESEARSAMTNLSGTVIDREAATELAVKRLITVLSTGCMPPVKGFRDERDVIEVEVRDVRHLANWRLHCDAQGAELVTKTTLDAGYRWTTKTWFSALWQGVEHRFVFVEPVQPTCTVCGAATTGARCEKCVPVVVAR